MAEHGAFDGPLLGPLPAGLPDGPIGVAVSGGGDSLALLILLQEAGLRPLRAVTVDHGLRPDSAAEAAEVAALCAARGIAHETLVWSGSARPEGNLQDQARNARRSLMAAWAERHGLAAVALGHTEDDQAETFLLRLARGSGVDGLSAMRPLSFGDGIFWVRPLLGVPREALRVFLRARGLTWFEDPSNDNPRFDRVRMRAALPELAALGLDARRLATTAAALGRARDALEQATADLASCTLEEGRAGDLILDRRPLAAAPEELRLRLLADALAWVSGARYRPRLESLVSLLAAIERSDFGGLTLHGCILRPHRGRIAIRREPARVAPPVPFNHGRWDGRWSLSAPAEVQTTRWTIGALGFSGLRALHDWRDTGLAREALASTPAVWQDDTLVGAPVLGVGPALTVRRFSAVQGPWYRKIVR